VQRDASIGEARALRDAMRESETARREGEVVKAEQERQVAEAQKERDVAKEQYRGETFAATNRADQQGPLFEARARQEVVTEQQRAARAAAEEQRYRAEMVIPAEASRQAAILKAEGEAVAILKIKEAEAKGIKLVLQAEADGLKEKAAAWEMYGEAAKLNLALEALKMVAEKGAAALGGIKFDKVIAIDGGTGEGGGSVARMMTAAPKALVTFIEQIKAATGVDLAALVPRLLEEKPATPVVAKEEEETE
jgi:flotillin